MLETRDVKENIFRKIELMRFERPTLPSSDQMTIFSE